MNLETLLEAARILEQRDSGPEKYASDSLAITRKERKVVRRSQTYRATHNQLEKNRRAHLRDCLTSLRDLVPTSPDPSSKVTTLSLLQNAKHYIQVLEIHDREAQNMKKKLFIEQQKLQKRLSMLLGDTNSNEICTVVDFPSAKRMKLDSSSSDEIDVENDDETGYGSCEDGLSSGGSSC